MSGDIHTHSLGLPACSLKTKPPPKREKLTPTIYLLNAFNEHGIKT